MLANRVHVTYTLSAFGLDETDRCGTGRLRHRGRRRRFARAAGGAQSTGAEPRPRQAGAAHRGRQELPAARAHPRIGHGRRPGEDAGRHRGQDGTVPRCVHAARCVALRRVPRRRGPAVGRARRPQAPACAGLLGELGTRRASGASWRRPQQQSHVLPVGAGPPHRPRPGLATTMRSSRPQVWVFAQAAAGARRTTRLVLVVARC